MEKPASPSSPYEPSGCATNAEPDAWQLRRRIGSRAYRHDGDVAPSSRAGSAYRSSLGAGSAAATCATATAGNASAPTTTSEALQSRPAAIGALDQWPSWGGVERAQELVVGEINLDRRDAAVVIAHEASALPEARETGAQFGVFTAEAEQTQDTRRLRIRLDPEREEGTHEIADRSDVVDDLR